MNTLIKALALGLAAILASPASLSEQYRSVGDVVEVDSGELIYREHHTFSKPPSEEFLQTDYKSPSGELIAERRVNFKNDYASDYTFKQSGLDIEIEVVRGQQTIKYTKQKDDKNKTKEFEVDNIETAVLNAGMFNAVEREWATLMNGDEVSIDLVVPDRGKAYTMNLKKVNLANSEMADHMDTDGKVVFDLVIANRLLRMLVSPVTLGYDVETKRLVFYQGPSNIRKSNGKKYGDIRITYENSTAE